MNKEQLLEKWGTPQKVGSGGFVRLVDTFGDDAAVVQAARVSYGAGTKSVSEDRGLIRYLMRHYHTSPFEQCSIKLHMRVDMGTWRQIIRHRTAKVNEYSTRYSTAIDEAAIDLPTEWRLQSVNNKQGSDGFLAVWPTLKEAQARLEKADIPAEDISEVLSLLEEATRYPDLTISPGSFLSENQAMFHSSIRAQYLFMLAMGVAREQARQILPLATYTEAYWTMDLKNLLDFLRLRLDSHAQFEVRQFAEAISNIVADWCPSSWEAFLDYRINAVTFSAQEMTAIKWLLKNSEFNEYVFDPNGECSLTNLDNCKAEFITTWLKNANLINKRERSEFLTKIGIINE